jgi:IS30 family transposase|tara:strand:+ start:2907 stop:3245 length:339 start_codon:yes stop_codon:yes gene_type:complete
MIGKGHRHTIISLTERKSPLAILTKVNRKTPQAVAATVFEPLKPLSMRAHAITADNGKEFAYHERIPIALSTEVDFVHPYSSHKPVTDENTNGLIRQYFPKKHLFLPSLRKP